MSGQQDAMQEIARQVRIALDGGDISSFSDLLDPTCDGAHPTPNSQRAGTGIRSSPGTDAGESRASGPA